MHHLQRRRFSGDGPERRAVASARRPDRGTARCRACSAGPRAELPTCGASAGRPRVVAGQHLPPHLLDVLLGHPKTLPRTAGGTRKVSVSGELRRVASTQDALYRRIDLDLSWSEPTSPSGSGRSTSTGCTRTSASSSRSSSRRCSRATCPAAGACSTRSPARARRSCRRSSAGYDATGADVAPFNCLLMRVKTRRVQPVRARVRAARRARAARPVRARATERPVSTFVRDWFAPQAARGAALLPRPRRGLRARRRPAGRAGARGAIGAADDALRPRLPAEAAEDAVLVPQAPARVPARRRGRAASCAATHSTRSRG